MSGAVEGVALREAIARVIAPDAFRNSFLAQEFERLGVGISPKVDAFAKADRILSLTTPPARSYADGVRDSAKVADDYERDRNTRARDKRQEGQDDSFHAASASAASRIAAAIRLLSQGEKA